MSTFRLIAALGVGYITARESYRAPILPSAGLNAAVSGVGAFALVWYFTGRASLAGLGALSAPEMVLA